MFFDEYTYILKKVKKLLCLVVPNFQEIMTGDGIRQDISNLSADTVKIGSHHVID
jgi:hypothetical protein